MKGPECSPEVRAAIASYRFLDQYQGDDAELAAVVATVRGWVADAVPRNADDARTCMTAVVRLMLRTKATLGTDDAPTVFADPNVGNWLLSGEHPYSENSLRTVRSLVRMVGRAALPRSVADPVALPASALSDPYSTDEERWFREAAVLPGYRNTGTRMWVVTAGLAAGLSGPEAAATLLEDVAEIGDGRLTVTVRGRNARVVPLRRDYTDLARAALAASSGGRFTASAHANNAYLAGRRIGNGFSFARARTTWLLSHVRAGTNPAALCLIAGPLSGETIRKLADKVAATMTIDEAVRLGMGP